jgi:hypothetical protein
MEIATRWAVLLMGVVLCCTLFSTAAFYFAQTYHDEFLSSEDFSSSTGGKVSINIAQPLNSSKQMIEQKDAQLSIRIS